MSAKETFLLLFILSSPSSMTVFHHLLPLLVSLQIFPQIRFCPSESGGQRSPGLVLTVHHSANRPKQELGHRMCVYHQSTSGLRRQQVNTFKKLPYHSQTGLGVCKGKSGHSSRGYVTVRNNDGSGLERMLGCGDCDQ